MPVLMRKDATFKYVLKGDRKLPEKDQPHFLFRAISGRQFIEITAMSDEVDDARDGKTEMSSAQLVEKMFEVVRKGLIGWSGMKDADGKAGPYESERLPDLVTIDELMELKRAMLAGPVTADDLKKSESQSPSSSDDSASTASPGDAPTP